MRATITPERTLLGLAAISALSLLPVYHRPYDAKMLLLALPACAMLWEKRGRLRWCAVAFTLAALLATSDLPLALMLILAQSIHVSSSTLSGKAVLALLHPAPLILLATGCFYLWVFITYVPSALRVEKVSLESDAVSVNHS